MNVQIRKPHSLPRFLLPVILLASCLPSFGQWRTEIFDLNPGWQAIYLRVDPGIDRSIATTLFAGGHTNVTEVWRWNPSGLDPTIFNDPQTPIVRPEWQVWERDNPSSLLSVWFPNSGYLVHVAEDAEPFQLEIKGTVTTPEIRWRTDGLNLLGFPTNPDDPPTVEEYFAPGLVNDQTEIFGYIGGPLISGTNPEQLVPDVAPLRRGAAYWVRTEKYADYDGARSGCAPPLARGWTSAGDAAWSGSCSPTATTTP